MGEDKLVLWGWEPGVPPLAPAVGNAIAAVTGKRMYAMPFQLGT